MDERIGFELYTSGGNRGVCVTCVCVAAVWVVSVGSGWGFWARYGLPFYHHKGTP